MTLALPQSLTLPPGRRLVLYIALSIAMFLTLSHTLVIMRHVSSESMVSAHSKLTKFMPLVFTTDACAKWDPRGAAENDPANCVRAGQFRGLQAFRAKGFKLTVEQNLAIRHAERCALGVEQCPERPLIVTDWNHAWDAARSSSGEAIWLNPVIETIREQGYAVLSFPGTYPKPDYNVWAMNRLLHESIHQYWTSCRSELLACFNDPRCVRPEDYQPGPAEEFRHDLSLVPHEDMGKLPAWRIFGVSFWGTRPDKYQGEGQSARYFFGVDGVETEWTIHPLGQRWNIVPYPYPGHTWLPMSIEQSCLSSPVIPHEKRNHSVAILAKYTDYFNGPWEAIGEYWSQIAAGLKEDGIEMWSFATKRRGKKDAAEVPKEFVDIGYLTRLEYGAKISSARALLGIGKPEHSPSPYVAICRGVPAVMPYFDNNPYPQGWEQFGPGYAQHGILHQLGEPYVFPYNGSDYKDMLRQIKQAVNTPIQPSVPYDMTMVVMRERVVKFLNDDWEGAYDRIMRDNKGEIPRLPLSMFQACFKTLCKGNVEILGVMPSG